MDTQALQTQQLTLLARKALLNDEISSIDKALGQIGAILQFVAQQPAPPPAAEPTPE